MGRRRVLTLLLPLSVLGLAVVIFLLFATVLAYFAYRNVWADRKAKKGRAAPAV